LSDPDKSGRQNVNIGAFPYIGEIILKNEGNPQYSPGFFEVTVPPLNRKMRGTVTKVFTRLFKVFNPPMYKIVFKNTFFTIYKSPFKNTNYSRSKILFNVFIKVHLKIQSKVILKTLLKVFIKVRVVT
jgi:hypothetical protein